MCMSVHARMRVSEVSSNADVQLQYHAGMHAVQAGLIYTSL